MHDATTHNAWSMMVPPGPVVPWTRTAGIRAGMDHAWIIRTTYWSTYSCHAVACTLDQENTYVSTQQHLPLGRQQQYTPSPTSERAWPPASQRNAVTQRSRSHDGPCMANLAGAHYESEYEQFPLSFPVRPVGSLDLGPPGVYVRHSK